MIAGFFPLFFKQYWSASASVSHSTFMLGAANSTASVLVALLAPILGAIADRGGIRKKMLMFFAVLGIVMTGSLSLVEQGQWPLAVVLFVMASLGFAGSNIFYDSLLVDVASRDQLDRVSARGYALGYLGGGLLFAVNVAMTRWPAWFGLADAAAAVRLGFLLVAIWWAVFSLPLLFRVHEKSVKPARQGGHSVAAGFRQLLQTFREIRRLRIMWTFLLAYWLYIDGVDTIVRMAVDYGLSIGLAADALIIALLITQFVGFPAAIAYGWLGQRIGAKTGILAGIGIYMLVTVWGASIDAASDFYALAVVIGLVQGGVQALSRSLYSRLIPAGKAGEFFGFYNMLGKFAAVIGPVLMGWVSVMTGNPRLSMLALLVLFGAGAWLLSRVDVAEGERLARLEDPVSA